MLSLSMLELLGLGEELPEDWRQLIGEYSDEHPLLFRWVEFAHVPPPELVAHFLIPLEWHASSARLVVTPWSGGVPNGVPMKRIPVDGLLLPYFRLYREVADMRVPQPLQMAHSHVNAHWRRAG